MSVENGSIRQYRAFYGERVAMPHEVLNLETLALIGFNFEKMFSNLEFPSTFWISIRILIQKMTKVSMQEVSRTEEKITADALLTAFGPATTQETIQPHQELTIRAQETHDNLEFNLIESRIAFITMFTQIRQIIIAFHQEQLQAIPTEEADKKVATYLSKQRSKSNLIITKSIQKSRIAFAVQQKKHEESRERLNRSLKIWMNFTSEISQIIIGGSNVMKQHLT
jgi:hypothetical protein